MDSKTNQQAMEDESLDNGVNPDTDNATSQNTNAEQQNEPQTEMTAEEQLKSSLDALNTELEEQKDKYLRLAAEFDNFRRRTRKEKDELTKNGGEKTISTILPIIDDMERAIENAQKTDNIQAVIEGLDLIYQKFLKILAQEGLERMEPKGESFDTDFHEAIALVPAADEEQKGKVLDCVQTGYKLNEKVIRHAKVVVAQ